jgi:hypothetical protein
MVHKTIQLKWFFRLLSTVGHRVEAKMVQLVQWFCNFLVINIDMHEAESETGIVTGKTLSGKLNN